MSNQIVPLGYANTFGDWIVTTNKVLAETNDIGANNYIKDSGTFTINSSGTGLLVKNDAIVQGVLTVAGSGSSATVQNDLTVQRQLYLSNTGTSFLANGTANILGNLLVGGMIMPTFGSGSNGISFLGGTTGDSANIKYYATAGDARKLHIQVTNDTSDDIYLDASGTVVIPNSRDSTSISSGAFVVTGGMGIGGDIYIGGTMKVQSTAEIQLGGKVNISNSMLVSANVDIGKRLTVSGNTTLGANLAVTGSAYFGNTTESTSYNNGAVVVAGGLGVGNLIAGTSIHSDGSISSSGPLYVNYAVQSVSDSTGAIQTTGGLAVAQRLNVTGSISANGVLYANNATDSSSLTTGSIITAGGAAITKKLYVGSNLNVASLTASKPVFTDADKNLTSTGVVPVNQGGTGVISSSTTGNVLTSNGTYWISSSRGFVTPEDYGAVGNGSTDDSTALQNAINTGKTVLLTEGKTYLHTTALSVTTSNQYIGGPGILRPSGAINGVVVSGGCYGVELSLKFDSAVQTSPGYALKITNANTIKIHKLHIFNAFGGLYIEKANTVVLEWMWAYVRGPGIKWYGSDVLRSDIFSIAFAVLDNSSSNQYGMDWSGNCHTLNIEYLGMVCGSSGKGMVIRNEAGGSTYPAIGRIAQVEIDYPSGHGIEITSGLDYDFSMPYVAGSASGSGIKIASTINSYQVRVQGGKLIGNARYGIENASTGPVLSDGATDLSTNTLGRSTGSVWTQLQRLVIDEIGAVNQNYYMTFNGSNPLLTYGDGSYQTFVRADNQLLYTMDGTTIFKLAKTYGQFYNTLYTTDISSSGSITATGNITAYSDARLKKNIEVIENALDKVDKLNGYTFERTDIDVGRQTGVIAQEVVNVLPEAVTITEDGTYTVAYGNMVGLLIESIKELNSQVTSLKEEIEKLKNPS